MDEAMEATGIADEDTRELKESLSAGHCAAICYDCKVLCSKARADRCRRTTAKQAELVLDTVEKGARQPRCPVARPQHMRLWRTVSSVMRHNVRCCAHTLFSTRHAGSWPACACVLCNLAPLMPLRVRAANKAILALKTAADTGRTLSAETRRKANVFLGARWHHARCSDVLPMAPVSLWCSHAAAAPRVWPSDRRRAAADRNVCPADKVKATQHKSEIESAHRWPPQPMHSFPAVCADGARRGALWAMRCRHLRTHRVHSASVVKWPEACAGLREDTERLKEQLIRAEHYADELCSALQQKQEAPQTADAAPAPAAPRLMPPMPYVRGVGSVAMNRPGGRTMSKDEAGLVTGVRTADVQSCMRIARSAASEHAPCSGSRGRGGMGTRAPTPQMRCVRLCVILRWQARGT